MDITWLFLILCPYMLLYFYFWDFTAWNHWKIATFWICGLFLLVSAWLLVNYFNPGHPSFPGLL
ncbi:hypothetical protein [Desulfotomaculum copahuensis]|nr:hypothetical protein [Desulfotomaculum copahuensis]